MQSSSVEQIAYKQNFVDQRLNYVSCTQIANRREAINELRFELESSQLFHGYRLQFQMAGETNWEVNSEMVIHREYFSKIMQGIPYHHTDPYSINHDTPPPDAKTQHENVVSHKCPNRECRRTRSTHRYECYHYATTRANCDRRRDSTNEETPKRRFSNRYLRCRLRSDGGSNNPLPI
jgi:hypothetical protein